MKQLWLYATFRYPVSKYNELHVANIPHCHRFRSVWNAKKENWKILQPVAAAAVVGRIDKSQKVQLFVVVAPFVNVDLLLLIMRNNSNKKRVQFEPKEVAHAPHVQHWGAERCVRRMQRQLLCLTFARDRRGEGSGTWLIAVAQFTTATHCDCCRLGHDSWHCCKLRTWTAEVDVGTQERGHARPLPPVLWPQLRLLHSDFQPYSHFSFYVLTLQMAA